MSLDENDFDVGAGNPGMDTWDDDDFYSESLQQVRGVLKWRHTNKGPGMLIFAVNDARWSKYNIVLLKLNVFEQNIKEVF